MTKIRAVLYDMDGTLLDTERLHALSWKKGFAMHGIEVSREFYESVMGTNAGNVKRVCMQMYGLDGEMMMELENQLTWEHMQKNGVPVLPGVKEALAALQKKGVRQCICTSTNRPEAVKWLRLAGLDSLVDAVVCGSDISNSKPAPDIFLCGAERTGVPIQDCAVVEDSRNGLLAGLNSGARAVLRVEGVLPIPPEIEAKTRFLRSFFELEGLLEEYQ